MPTLTSRMSPDRPPRPDYRVPVWRDALGASRDLPRYVADRRAAAGRS